MTEIAVKAASTRQVVGCQDRIAGAGRVNGRVIRYQASRSALRGIGKSRLWIAVDVDAWGIVGGVDDAKTVILTQEGLLVDRAHLDVVDSLLVGEIRAQSGIGERPVLCDRRGLQVRGTEIGQGIAAGVVIVCIAANVAPKLSTALVPKMRV